MSDLQDTLQLRQFRWYCRLGSTSTTLRERPITCCCAAARRLQALRGHGRSTHLWAPRICRWRADARLARLSDGRSRKDQQLGSLIGIHRDFADRLSPPDTTSVGEVRFDVCHQKKVLPQDESKLYLVLKPIFRRALPRPIPHFVQGRYSRGAHKSVTVQRRASACHECFVTHGETALNPRTLLSCWRSNTARPAKAGSTRIS